MSFTDEEFARIKRFVERRGRDATQVTVASIDTALPCSPRSRSPETSLDTRVYMEKKDGDMEKRTWVAWTQSETSSNHHRPVRVLKHPDSSVTQTGRLVKPPPPAACPRTWVRIWGETLLHLQNALAREPTAKLRQRLQHRTPFSCNRDANPETRRHLATKTSSSTPVGKEESHRLGKRLYW